MYSNPIIIVQTFFSVEIKSLSALSWSEMTQRVRSEYQNIQTIKCIKTMKTIRYLVGEPDLGQERQYSKYVNIFTWITLIVLLQPGNDWEVEEMPTVTPSPSSHNKTDKQNNPIIIQTLSRVTFPSHVYRIFEDISTQCFSLFHVLL